MVWTNLKWNLKLRVLSAFLFLMTHHLEWLTTYIGSEFSLDVNFDNTLVTHKINQLRIFLPTISRHWLLWELGQRSEAFFLPEIFWYFQCWSFHFSRCRLQASCVLNTSRLSSCSRELSSADGLWSPDIVNIWWDLMRGWDIPLPRLKLHQIPRNRSRT